MTSSKPSSPPRSPSKERKEDEEEGGGGGGEENDRTSSEGLKKDEKTKEQMEVGEEKVGEKDDEVKNTLKELKTKRELSEQRFQIHIVALLISQGDFLTAPNPPPQPFT